ncbi:Receptor-like protein kinase HSL1 [Camellia lanceoleosa]|uniref:Receptor-like protein kinase HSL1 n=1 Tax=Camellia lanceoleosa TaxID=1840588 RepID=A0ACC0FG32_9ERIC|nr:Receptor-like protein kinase HSL1 [Camellia lanceoleosa]
MYHPKNPTPTSKTSKITPIISLQIPFSIFTLQFLTLPLHANPLPTDLEQIILLKMKQHWSNPHSISHWTPPSNSNSTIHCHWPEITCTNGSITGLSLIDKNITGTIPPFICDLKNLTAVDLHYNYIPGPFPTVLYNCSQLEHLDLSQNFFVGHIPSDIDRLSTQLRTLNLSGNNFTGDIPAAIGRFPELTALSLFQNEFDGSFPTEIGNLSNLEMLELSDNEFVPMAMPPSFTQLRKLKQLLIKDSSLIGEIPETIGNLTELEELDLSNNNLTGTIPTGLFLLKNLTTLYLYKNHLSGAIPLPIEALKMEIIDLSQNNLTGTIPDDFGKLTKLSGLALFYNQLSGDIPETIGRLPSLRDVKLFYNNLSGTLPPDFGRYSKLRGFEVSSNSFTGKLPQYLCANGGLLGIVAFDNNLSGELPNSLGNCSSLLIVRVHGNCLSGSISPGLWTSPNLTILMLSDNSFTGQLPDTLAPNLSRIEISNNEFSGGIPSGLSSWKHLTVFSASNNLFSGTVPQELTALPLLTTLLLDGNQFSGHFPSDILSWKSLTSLNLSRNQLSGPIPAKFGSLPSLTNLDLSGNQFSGQIPPQIGFLMLISLNLSSNCLTGRIPAELEKTFFNTSFLNNPGLCASNPSLGFDVCYSGFKNLSTIFKAILLVSAMLLTFFLIKTRWKRWSKLDSKWELTHYQIFNLSFEVSDILSNLTENNVIGCGGSGKVYRVDLNRSSQIVAVKRIQSIKNLDQKLEKEFLAEVQILGTIRHSNIVKLLSSISSETTKLLVYEYLGNHSLDWWLHGNKWQSISDSIHRDILDWPKRLQIAVGAAQGLCYMHHDCKPSVIHRDVKSSNILLDSQFNAKVADFGLAKILVKHEEHNTMSTVAGSFGYIAPEYARTRRVNEKVDVYSFGVVLLELVTGRKANDGNEDMCLADWAFQCYNNHEGNHIVDILDEKVTKCHYLDNMTCVFKLGIICTCPLPSNRPSMKEVLRILLNCNHQPRCGGCNVRSEYDCSPDFPDNFKHWRIFEGQDGNLLSKV